MFAGRQRPLVDTVQFEATEGTWITVDVSLDARLSSSGPEYEMQPRFSPDGRKILCTSDRGGGDNIRQSENVLYTMINGRLYDALTLDEIEPEHKVLPKEPNLESIGGKDGNHSCIGE